MDWYFYHTVYRVYVNYKYNAGKNYLNLNKALQILPPKNILGERMIVVKGEIMA